MNIRDISTCKFSMAALIAAHNQPYTGHAHVWPGAQSRRQFIRSAASAASVGAALGSRVWRPSLAEAHWAHEPVPIPRGTSLLGGAFHVFGPGLIDPIDAEPSTITDFNGFVGITFVSGEVTRTNAKTGEVRTLPFLDSDMRFMEGIFLGTDGRVHQRAFAFV
jgi:hypothetical protein